MIARNSIGDGAPVAQARRWHRVAAIAAAFAVGAIVIVGTADRRAQQRPRHPPDRAAVPSPGASGDADARRLGAESPVRSQAVPPAGLANAGNQTPEACLETLIWAASHGEVGVLAGTLALSPASRRAVTALLDRLPPAQRAHYQPPERFVALLWAREWMNEGELSACRVSDVTEQAGALSFGLDWVFQGGAIRRSRLTLVRDASGWRQRVRSSFVDGLVTESILPRRPQPPR